MVQFTTTDAHRATAVVDSVESQVEAALDWLRPQLLDWARGMQGGQLTPAVFFRLELSLVVLLRDFGRFLLELLLNGCEGDGGLLPHDLIYEGQGYRRLGKKTRNAHVATLFGTICLWRFGYRFWEPLVKESCIFPLELQLGLIVRATPALADYIGRQMAEAGSTQSRVLRQLKEEHGISMGVKRLRKLVWRISEGLSEHRQAAQVEELLRILHMTDSSSGNRKPVLAVGRDGITLCEYQYRFFEVATTATVTVFDRADKRLKTIYLAWRPELGQSTMSQMLNSLLTEVLAQWPGPLPTLAYVADSGGKETSYFEDTLRRMCHPRTGAPLDWQRVVDFYHAAERVWAIAAALFGQGTAKYWAWGRRMLRILKGKPRGAKRVLHSAAALAPRRKMGKSRREEFRKACNYIRKRTKWMRYCEYKNRHIPLGSGITEAACKTVFTQRLKLSGMRWKKIGAQHILTLRTILLSNTWTATYAMTLSTQEPSLPIPYAAGRPKNGRKAA
ncbi:MAG: hypothetical protein GXY83_24415 [Rhodopirellula sp.]|nr:hypothetical protein [Rhodopirellula sp.]